MSFKKWGISFPVILNDLGPERVRQEAAAMGQTEFIVCALIYHGYRMVLPRSPRQIYALEAGMTFYPADPSCYQDCAIPQQSTRDFAGRDLFAETAAAAEKHGIGLHAWVTCFANSRVARDYPEMAVQNLYGSRDRLFLCFNNPEVRKFVQAMMLELVSRYPLRSLMADKIPQAMLELNSFAGRIDPLLRLAGSVCFCQHCLAKAQADGVDLAGAKEILARAADASRKVPQWAREAMLDDLRGDTEIPLFLLEEPLIYEVLNWRTACVAEFLADTRARVRGQSPETTLSACLVPPVKVGHDATSPRAWLGAQTYRKFAQVVDAIHGVIHWEPEIVAYDTRRARDMVDQGNPNCELVIHVAAYGRRRPDEMPALVAAARGQGADSMCFFCHDLLEDPMIEALQGLGG